MINKLTNDKKTTNDKQMINELINDKLTNK